MPKVSAGVLVVIRQSDDKIQQIWYRWKNNEIYQRQYNIAEPSTGWKPWTSIPTARVLYNNKSGTNGTVTLSESASNFDYIEIFYENHFYNYNQSEKIYLANGERAELTTTGVFVGEKTVVTDYKVISISDTSIITLNYGTHNSWDNSFTATNRIYIYKVVGHKY